MPLIRNLDGNVIADTTTAYDGLKPNTDPVEARKNDLLRITEWLKSPAGLKFAAKQGLLRATAGNSSTNRADLARNIGKGATDAASAIAVILAQIPVAGTGTHFLFNELSSLAFQDSSFYTNNRFASMQANYRGTINIKKSDRIRGEKTLESYYNPVTPGVRERGTGTYDPINESVFTEELKEDLVPLSFKVQGISDGIGKTLRVLQFRGYFSGNLSDSFNGSWNNINYIGRGENFYTYGNFTRNISFGFSVAAFTENELEPMIGKVNALASLTAPTYSYDGFMRGTLVKLTIGDYVTDLLGKVDSITVDTDFNSTWEILPGKVLPMVTNVSVQFTPIHNFVPQTVLVDDGKSYIGKNTYITD